jgi:hypothetical protein
MYGIDMRNSIIGRGISQVGVDSQIKKDIDFNDEY